MNRIVSFFNSLSFRRNQERGKAEQFTLPIRLISGKHATSGREMKFLYSGHNRFNQNMWGDYLLSGFNEKILNPINLNKLKLKAITQKFPGCTFLLVEKNLLKGRQNFDIPRINIPNWIQTYIDTSRPVEQLCKPSKSGFNNARRLIRKYSITCHDANTPEDRTHFYEHMYLPYLRKNTHRYLRELPYEDIFKSSRPYQLYFIRMEGNLVGGAVATFPSGRASFGFLGITDGDAGFVKMGVISAMYYFLADSFHQRKIDKMFLGGSPPFLNHPLTRYKIRMSALHVYDHHYKDHEISTCFILDQEKAMESLFSLTPFVFLKNQDASCLINPTNLISSEQMEFEKTLELPVRLGIKNNICLKSSDNMLSADLRNALSEQSSQILPIKKFLNHHKGTLK